MVVQLENRSVLAHNVSNLSQGLVNFRVCQSTGFAAIRITVLDPEIVDTRGVAKNLIRENCLVISVDFDRVLFGDPRCAGFCVRQFCRRLKQLPLGNISFEQRI